MATTLTQVDDAATLGLDGGKLARAYELLNEWTRKGDPPMPAAALLVGRGDRYLTPRFFGSQGPEPDAGPVRNDGIFLLASITKPVVYMAALQLVEQGLLCLSDPVVRYLPAFAANHKTQVRVVDLFTHTSGLPDQLPDNEELRARHAPLERFIRGAIETAPLFEPRTDWKYQSMGTLVVAELVQQLSGKSIAEYLKDHIFTPLGMKDSALGSKGLDLDRLVRVEVTQPSDWDWNSTYWREFGAPWGGMFSTPANFARLCHSLLQPTAPQILSRTTVRTMRQNHLRFGELPEAVRLNHAWGLGWKVNVPMSDEALGDLLGPDVFGHTGASGTIVWMDPDLGLYMILFTTGLRSKAPWRLRAISNIVAASVLPTT